MKASLVRVLGCMLLAAVVALVGCATPKKQVEPAVMFEPDMSEPTLPIFQREAIVIQAEQSKPVVEAPARGSVASIINKLPKNPYTRYLSEENAYSFYLGGVLSAKYKPGGGLLVKEATSDDSGIICQFDESSADTVTIDQACTTLMFTLDDELSD